MKLAMVVLILAMQRMEAGQSASAHTNWAAKGAELSKAGDYRAAAAAFRQALAADEAHGIADGQTIGTYEFLAAAYTEMGQFADARDEYRRALLLMEKIDSGNILLRGLIIARTAALPGDGNNDKTITELREAIDATGQTASGDQLAVMRVSLAQILSRQKQYREAEKLLLDAIGDLRKEKNPAPRRLSDSLNALGVLLLDQQRYVESAALFREAIEVSEHVLGTEHPVLIPVLNNLATSYLKMGRPQEAATVLQHTIAVAGKTLGEDHPNYGLLLTNYAVALKELGRKQEAKQLEVRSRKIESAFRRRSGLDSTIAITSLLPAKKADGPRRE